jgi:uncharacterized membrane protein
MSASSNEWEGLDPWEKAAQWKAVAPEITDELVRLAKAKAIQDRREQSKRAEVADELARFEREMQKEAADRAYQLEIERVELERKRDERAFEVEKERLAIKKSLERRFWWLQLISLVGGLLVTAALIVTALYLSQSAALSSTSISVFGLVGTLTAALFGANAATSRKLQAILKNDKDQAGSKATHESDKSLSK